MRCSLLLLVSLTCASVADTPDSSAIAELRAWIARPAAERTPLKQAALSKAEAKIAADLLWTDHAARIRKERAEEMKAEVIKEGDKELKFHSLRFGPDTPPATGRSLFISMHGGGGTAPQVNDQQWANQLSMGKAYKPAEGIYLAPRAPTDAWNLWHEAHIDKLFARLVENLIVLEQVNPDRVYLMGYSAGGDGVYQLAPRMSDWWAAAAMMAGHPNETKAEGVRNVPFILQVGELDGGYNRNKIAAEWAVKLDALHQADSSGYLHEVELHKGKSHWMNMEDRKAIPWMEKYSRNPSSDRLVWVQDDVTHDRHYWLAVPAGTAKVGTQIIAEHKAQTISLTASAPAKVIVMLNDSLLDLDQPIEIRSGSKQLFNGKVQRSAPILARTLAERGDPRLMFSAEIAVEIPQ